MARADVVTLLPLDTYAQILGINPLHFNGARLPGVSGGEPFTIGSERPLWHQYAWQGNNISRDYLARVIQQAERDIANFLGYWPAPQWTSQEVHRYPRPNRPEYYDQGINVRGQFKEIQLNYKKIISTGQRASDLISVETVAYSDPNGDGWNTLATITATTVLTNECEIKLYFVDKDGDPRWEIRPLKSIAISGGVVTITLDSWLLLDPLVTNKIPTGETISIDASDTGTNYVATVEVRREYTDTTATSAQFFWEREPLDTFPVFCCTACGSTGCEACSLITATGCAQVRDVENGLIAVIPASYDTEDARWERDLKWDECRAPDEVKVWYKSGNISELGFRGDCQELDMDFARIITVLATARLEWRFHANSPIHDTVEFWRRDQSESLPNGSTIFTPPEILGNPFGTRRGEVETYKRLSSGLRQRKVKASAVAA